MYCDRLCTDRCDVGCVNGGNSCYDGCGLYCGGQPCQQGLCWAGCSNAGCKLWNCSGGCSGFYSI